MSTEGEPVKYSGQWTMNSSMDKAKGEWGDGERMEMVDVVDESFMRW
jgi:hypothetical protein